MKRKTLTIDQQKSIYDRIHKLYPDRVPIIIESGPNCKIDLKQRRYLTSADITIGQFMYTIRKRCHLKPDEAIFIFVDRTIPPMSITIGQLHKEHRSESGLLFITISSESTFG